MKKSLRKSLVFLAFGFAAPSFAVDVSIPGALKYREKFRELGFEFPDEPSENSLLITAKLPEGWRKIDSPSDSDSPDIKFYEICDSQGIPRVKGTVKTAFYDSRASAFFLTEEEGRRKLADDRLAEEKKEATKKAGAEEEAFLLNVRASIGSPQNSYAVIFEKDLRDLHAIGFSRNESHSACMGFFPDEETVKRAVVYLRNKASCFDSVFGVKIDKSNSSIFKSKYKIVDFGDNDWWNKRDFVPGNSGPVWND